MHLNVVTNKNDLIQAGPYGSSDSCARARANGPKNARSSSKRVAEASQLVAPFDGATATIQHMTHQDLVGYMKPCQLDLFTDQQPDIGDKPGDDIVPG